MDGSAACAPAAAVGHSSFRIKIHHHHQQQQQAESNMLDFFCLLLVTFFHSSRGGWGGEVPIVDTWISNKNTNTGISKKGVGR